MNNSMQPVPESPGASGSFAKPSSTPQSKNPAVKAPQKPIQAKQVTKTPAVAEEKVGFFKRLFGGGKAHETVTTIPKVETEVKAAPVAAAVAEVPAISEAMTKRHDDLIKSVDDICKSLEASKPHKVELSVTDIIAPIPTENLDALTKTQVQVGGVLEKVAGRLDEAGKRDGMVMDSLSRMDGTLSALSKVSDRSVKTMDGMKGIFTSVNGSMESVQTELKKSGERYEKLYEKARKTDKENAETIAKLQKRTLMVTVLLGVALVAGLIIVSMGS